MGGKKKNKCSKDLKRYRSDSMSSNYSEESSDNNYNTVNTKYLLNRINPKYVNPKSKSQSLFISLLKSKISKIIVCHGSAGTGKTLLSCQEGIRSLCNEETDRIIITRPAVSADEDIGFLPGDLDEKMRPFTQPLFDNFEKVLPKIIVNRLILEEKIQIIPLAYMRGRTFENKFIIADEMQNSSPEQMIMLLTRLGHNSKLVILGDPNQCDRKIKFNGLADLISRIKIKEDYLSKISCIQFENKDIQREDAVKEVLNILYCN